VHVTVTNPSVPLLTKYVIYLRREHCCRVWLVVKPGHELFATSQPNSFWSRLCLSSAAPVPGFPLPRFPLPGVPAQEWGYLDFRLHARRDSLLRSGDVAALEIAVEPGTEIRVPLKPCGFRRR